MLKTGKSRLKDNFLTLWLSNLKIKYMLIIGFLFVILFSLVSYLIIGPRLLYKSMEDGIEDRINDILYVLTKYSENAQEKFYTTAFYISKDSELRQLMDYENKKVFESRVSQLKNYLLHNVDTSKQTGLEIIFPRGLMKNSETLKAINNSAYPYADKTLVNEIQNSIEAYPPMNQKYIQGGVQIRINNGQLVMQAINPIFCPGETFKGMLVITEPLHETIGTYLREEMSDQIYFTIYRIDQKTGNAVSVGTTIRDDDGEPAVGRKSIPAVKLQKILEMKNSDINLIDNKRIENMAYKAGYNVLIGGNNYILKRPEHTGTSISIKNPNAVGLLEVAVSSEKILKATEQQKKQIYLIAGVGIILSLLIISWILYNINQPLSQLIIGTEMVAKGDLKKRINIPARNELGYLAEKFNWMTENIYEQRTELLDKQKELIRQKEELVRYQDELVKKEKLAAVGNFVSTIIHDLKNPLMAILWYAELLRQTLIAQQGKTEYAQYIIDEVKRLREMTTEVLDFVRGTLKLNRKICRLSYLMDDIFTFLERTFVESNIEMFLVQEFEGEINIDADKFRRVIYNITNNARDIMVGGGVIIIATAIKDSNVEITISNTGKGMPKDIMEHLFQPFFTANKQDGVGLGLSICQKIIQEHDGSIYVENKEGIGTTFIIHIPIAKSNKDGLVA